MLQPSPPFDGSDANIAAAWLHHATRAEALDLDFGWSCVIEPADEDPYAAFMAGVIHHRPWPVHCTWALSPEPHHHVSCGLRFWHLVSHVRLDVPPTLLGERRIERHLLAVMESQGFPTTAGPYRAFEARLRSTVFHWGPRRDFGS